MAMGAWANMGFARTMTISNENTLNSIAIPLISDGI